MADIARLGIEIDTRGLRAGERDLNRFGASASSAASATNTATRAVASLVGAIAVGKLIEMADSFAMMTARISRFTESASATGAVMQQLTNYANASGQALGDVVSVFASISSSANDLGKSQSSILRFTQLVNEIGYAGGSSAEAIKFSMRQMSQSFAGGIVRAEEFNSMIENTPEIVRAAAKGMGISMGEIRQKMLAGKLSAVEFYDAIMSQGSAIDAMFNQMPRTVAAAMQTLGNEFTALVGTINNTTGATGGLSAAIDNFSGGIVVVKENLGAVVTAAEALALVFGSRLVGGMVAASAAKLQVVAADRALVVAEVSATNAAVRKAVADKSAALSAVALAQAEYNVAKGSNAEAFALQALVAAKTAARNASLNLVVATQAQTAAQRAAAVGATALKGAMAMLGGPAGVVMLAVSAIYMWVSAAEDARQKAIDYADGVDTATASLRNMTSAQLAASQVKLNQSIDAQSVSVSDLRSEVDELQSTVNKQIAVSKMLGNATAANTYEMDQLKLKSAELEAAENKLSQMRSKSYAITQTLNGNLKDNYVAMQNSNSVTGIANGIQSVFNGVLSTGNKLLQQRNNYVLLGNGAKSNLTATDQKYLTQLENEIALEKELDPIKRARIKAEQEAATQGLSASGTTQYINQSVKLAEIQAKNDAAAKSLTAAHKSEASAIKEASKSTEEYLQYKQELSRLNATEAQQIQNWQADQLTKLESFHAQSLVKESEYQWGKQAITEEANRRLQKLNDDQWSEYLNGSSAALLKLKQQAQTQLTGPKQQIVVSGIDQKLKEQTFANLPTIDAGSQTNEQNQIAQLQTQTTAMNDAYNQRIDDYKRFRALEVENAAYYDGQIAALEKKKEENNEAAQEAMMNLQLQAGESMATSAADSLKKMVGEQSSAYKTMFAVQKAFSIARAILAIKTGIASAWEAGWPNGAIYAAGVVAATGSLVSDIMSVASPSFDGGGYTGNGSRTGGLDGKGGFWAMMHPQETVIDHTKSSGSASSGSSSGGNVTVNVSLQETSNTSQQGTTSQSTNDDGSVQISVFVSDIRSEGSMAQVLERTYGLTRMGA